MEYNICESNNRLEQINYMFVRLNKQKYLFNKFEFLIRYHLVLFSMNTWLREPWQDLLYLKNDLITPVNVFKCLLYNKINSIFPIAIVKMHNRIIFTQKFKIGSLDLLQTRQIQTIL